MQVDIRVPVAAPLPRLADFIARCEDEGFDGGSLPEMASLIIQIGKAAWQVAQVGDERQVERARQTLAETRRALYGILAEDSDTSEDTDATA